MFESNPDILGISETWLHDGIDSSEIHIPNYNVLQKERGDGHGGVAIYVSSRLVAHQIHLSDVQLSKVETLWMTLKLPNTHPIYTGIVYSPNACNEFFEELELVFDEIIGIDAGTRTQGEIICLGDFNCDSYKPND